MELKPLPLEESIRFFRRKGLRPLFSWRDVWQEEHAKAFIVSKVMRQDVVEAIFNQVLAAIDGGRTAAQAARLVGPRPCIRPR